MKLHVAKFAADCMHPGKEEFYRLLNAHVADGTSLLCDDNDFEQKPGDDGVHLLTNGLLVIHNHAHYILASTDEGELTRFVDQLKSKINSLTFLVFDTEDRNADGMLGAAPKRNKY